MIHVTCDTCYFTERFWDKFTFDAFSFDHYYRPAYVQDRNLNYICLRNFDQEALALVILYN